jgi:hypothetical protein
MKMCEYVNNLFDMGFLFYVSKKNKKIVYDRKSYRTRLLNFSAYSGSLDMVFPRMYEGINYIILCDCFYEIMFENVKATDLTYFIISGD